jgi:hypothetical protein
MTRIGYALIVVGFLAGALVAVVDEEVVRWSNLVAALAAGAMGVVLVRISTRREARAEGKLSTNLDAVDSSLVQIVEKVNQLCGEMGDDNPYEARTRIDELLPVHFDTFVEARRSIAHYYGLQAYADVMSPYAAGERHINRVWSASADGYVDEVREYLQKAAEQFAEALDTLRGLQQQTTT